MNTSEELPAADGLDNPAVFQAVEDYLAAIQLGRRPDRASFLAQHPDIASELAECLDALEFVQAAASSLDGTDKNQANSPAAGLPQPGTILGDYRILREVGRGGMGVVYEAEQLSLDRRIALKVLPFAMTLDPRQLQRFRNEAQAAAGLHHANIVPVFAVGCENGVHFYAMQFVAGRTLSALVADLRRTQKDANRTTTDVGEACQDVPTVEEDCPAEPSDTLHELISSYTSQTSAFTRDVARLGVQAAEALDHAHQMGIVHRDIKPANLMVEGDGHLWVTDFGLARCQGDTALTAPGDVVGTLRYMPPEQALAFRDLVDHRADVYSLGATLYELLTLRPVFNGRDRRELLRQIERDEPCPLRRWNPFIPRDLETIVLKAMSKSVADRYPTAQAMADDLRRFLEDRPIQARPPSLPERLARWTRRHAAVVRAVTAVLVLTVVGLGATAVMVNHERKQAIAEREAALENFRQARAAVDFFAQVSREELPNEPELVAVRRKLLDRARVYYEAFIDRCQDDPRLAEELRVSHAAVVQIRDQLQILAVAEQGRRHAQMLVATQHLPDGGVLHLLASHAVQKELKLTTEQIGAIERLRVPVADPQRQQRERTFLVELQPEQARRFAEIALQQRGPDALTDQRIADTLGLTDQQRERIRKFLAEWHTVLGPSFIRSGRQNAGNAPLEQALGILTPLQRQRWQQMAGEPFHDSSPQRAAGQKINVRFP